MLFPKNGLPALPKSDWKKDLKFSPLIEAKKPILLQGKNGLKPIAKISKKKRDRINNEGSEVDLFKRIWSERKHECEICRKVIKNPKPHHFDHKIQKSRGNKYRLDPNNIQILCFADHFEKTTGLKYKGIDLD